MESRLQMFFIVAVIIYLAVIIQLLKKRKLNLKYTLIWLAAAFVLLVVTIFPGTVYTFSNIIGIQTPINSALVLACMFVLMILITLTVIVSELNQTVRTLTQKIGLLEKRIRKIEKDDKE